MSAFLVAAVTAVRLSCEWGKKSQVKHSQYAVQYQREYLSGDSNMSIEEEMECQTNRGLSEASPLSVPEDWRDLAFISSAGTFSVTPEKTESISLGLNRRERAQETQL